MIQVPVEMVFRVISTPDVDLSSHIDRVMDALGEIPAIDPYIQADLGERRVEIGLVAEGEDSIQATQNALGGTIRAAIHAAGGATPYWEHST